MHNSTDRIKRDSPHIPALHPRRDGGPVYPDRGRNEHHDRGRGRHARVNAHRTLSPGLFSHFPRVLRRSHVLHAPVAGERDGRDDQGGRVREMQPPASRAGPAHRRGQVQRRARAVPGQRTLHTDHGGPEQLHIPHAQRPHGRAGESLPPVTR